jgi:hypothetical protein
MQENGQRNVAVENQQAGLAGHLQVQHGLDAEEATKISEEQITQHVYDSAANGTLTQPQREYLRGKVFSIDKNTGRVGAMMPREAFVHDARLYGVSEERANHIYNVLTQSGATPTPDGTAVAAAPPGGYPLRGDL